MISEKLKARFCKDCGIPIKLFREPYFMDRLVLLNDMYGSVGKWYDFISELEGYEDEKDFLDYCDKVVNIVIEHIKSTDGFQDFNCLDMNKFSRKVEYPKSDIYKDCNCDKMYISIDMKKANFSALRYYDSSIFNNKSTWEDFIGVFTKSKYIAGSKYIRQVIFGNCNSKRQGVYERYLMLMLLDKIKETSIISDSDIVSVTNDEIVIDVTSCEDSEVILSSLNKVIEAQDVPFHVSLFKLQKLYNVGYLRKFNDGTYDIKGVDMNYVPMVVRLLNGQAITDDDMVFMNNKVLCKYLECPISTI